MMAFTTAVSDAELDAYYSAIYESAYGYDPEEGPYEEEDDYGRTYTLESCVPE